MLVEELSVDLSCLLPLMPISHILDSSTVRAFKRLSIIQLYAIKNHIRKIGDGTSRGSAVFETDKRGRRGKNRHPTAICILWRLVRPRRAAFLLKGSGNDSGCVGGLRHFDISLR